ncbi:putative conjugative transposon mobilization protein BF0132 [Bacteroides pyogenes JCM 10003]|nr:putative conjugative transposon mobilization protein BF0132 [Bacteroides pyogenes JCM 10003]
MGSSLFGALAYNQNKVDEEQGKVLFSNRMFESEDGNFNIQRCMESFEMHLPQDIKTEKPIIHISLNPHPDDKLSDEQLSEIAQEYMEKLGYGNQPTWFTSMKTSTVTTCISYPAGGRERQKTE